jgi:hypothetical protein
VLISLAFVGTVADVAELDAELVAEEVAEPVADGSADVDAAADVLVAADAVADADDAAEVDAGVEDAPEVAAVLTVPASSDGSAAPVAPAGPPSDPRSARQSPTDRSRPTCRAPAEVEPPDEEVASCASPSPELHVARAGTSTAAATAAVHSRCVTDATTAGWGRGRTPRRRASRRGPGAAG